MYCANCGEQTTSSNNFCTNCGHKISPTKGRGGAHGSAISEMRTSKSNVQTSTSIRRGHHASVSNAELTAGAHRRNRPEVEAAKSEFLGSLLYSLALLVLGGVVSGLSYAFAEPGGTYYVTSGLLLFGGVYFLVAIYKLLKWTWVLASKR